ncbi:outer membrane lipoprotein carrier protein LolA [Streptomyces sp. SID12501]|uniref:Outer membrane lipoprotein carrier protein LolA n=1 Tax=Streptomyces sp. SID12501 TaxID=2706042 RepID=A0A6B3BP24_9ACTN|nr:outer membrane lipoprotein carrier protein LolA [Streptomyces sp. SID12501]NEC86070.1 outer membrane lipoprotein carrier protein LolA [Streptomyces sp. SID12501]
MAPYEEAKAGNRIEAEIEAEDVPSRRRKAARYAAPAVVIGLTVATIGLVPAFAGSGDPDLPKISAKELIEKIAASDVQQLSGTVKISTDLGLPDLGGLESGLLSGGLGGGSDGSGSAADPSAKLLELATGTHTVRVAVDGPDKQKLSLLEKAAEYSVIHNGDEVWAYDSASNEAYHATAPASESGKDKSKGKDRILPGDDTTATPGQLAEEALKAVDDTTSVTVDGTAQVAGRDAYKLVIKPKAAGSTVGAISIAVDSKTGTPLKFTLTPASGGAAVVDAGFVDVDFGKPAASTFDFTPPKGTKVTEEGAAEVPHDVAKGGADFDRKFDGKLDKKLDEDLKGFEGHEGAPDGLEGDGGKVIGEGWNSIAVFDSGTEGGGLPSADSSSEAGAFGGFLDSFGDKVSGDFGSGTVYKTRLINALMTDDGKLYVGAVTKDALVKAANAAE